MMWQSSNDSLNEKEVIRFTISFRSAESALVNIFADRTNTTVYLSSALGKLSQEKRLISVRFII